MSYETQSSKFTDLEAPDENERSKVNHDGAAPEGMVAMNGGYYLPPTDKGDDLKQVTNFKIKTLERLEHNDGTRNFRLQIIPADDDPYELVIEPSVLNDLGKFRSKVLASWSPTFYGGRDELNRIKEFVARQDVAKLRGTDTIGLYGHEFVTPDGSITADGWTDEPEFIHTDEDSQLPQLWALDPESTPDYDEQQVAEILRTLPKIRDSERLLPVLGWFYAAPFRPLVQEWEDEFNMLHIRGETGSGKTATIQQFQKLFGLTGEPLDADSTQFVMLTAIAATNAVPIVFDEYKPAEMSASTQNALHRYIRGSTRGAVESKGNADRTVDNYHLSAPICVVGEQQIQEPAVERRAIETTFRRETTTGDTAESRAFRKLTGGMINGQRHEPAAFAGHALAYYEWATSHTPEVVRENWDDAGEWTAERLEKLPVDETELDDIVVQGLQTIRFGCDAFGGFASEFDIEKADVGVTDEAIERAIKYVGIESGGADRTSYLDRFLELATRAADADYLEDEEHYRVMNGGDELRLHLDRAFDKVNQYVKEHGLNEELLTSSDDYKDRLSVQFEQDDGCVTEKSQPTNLSDGRRRCWGLDIQQLNDEIEGFEPAAFGA